MYIINTIFLSKIIFFLILSPVYKPHRHFFPLPPSNFVQIKQIQRAMSSSSSTAVVAGDDEPFRQPLPEMISDDASAFDNAATQTFAFSSGNPRIEETRGVMHLFSSSSSDNSNDGVVSSPSPNQNLPVLAFSFNTSFVQNRNSLIFILNFELIILGAFSSFWFSKAVEEIVAILVSSKK